VGFRYIRQHIAFPDLLHLHVALPVGKVALWWHFRHKIPYLLTEHWSIYTPANFARCSFMQRKWLTGIGNCAAQILPVSESLLSNMRWCGIKTEATVVPNVVDVGFFCPDLTADLTAKDAKDFAKDFAKGAKMEILHVSTLDEDAKNIWGILHVIEKLYAQRQDFVLQIVHDYPRPDLEAYVKQHHLGSVVMFNGRKTTSELLEYYRKAAFVLLFSNYENQPCVLLEAFAVGKPVLATTVGAIPEMVSSERGRLVAPKDETALLEQLNVMLDKSSEYDSSTIRHYVMQQFTPQAVGMALAEVYRKTAPSNPNKATHYLLSPRE
jgi:glycosyltransferase involved in cell wall biosynthesis